MDGIDVDHVSTVMRRLLLDAGRDVLFEDHRRGETMVVPIDVAAARDGLLPAFLSTGEAISLEAFGSGFGLALEHDPGAFFSWKVREIKARTFSEVMLTTMEAMSQASSERGILVLELPRVFDEAVARFHARKARK